MGNSIPALMIEKCAQIIENVIIPALTDDAVLGQARHTAAILYTLAPAVEEKSKGLIEENRAMGEVLGKAKRALGRKALSSNRVWVQLMEALDLELKNCDQSDVLQANHRLKAVLAHTIVALDSLADEVSPKRVSSLKEQIHGVMRQQINNGMARLPVFQMKL